MSEQCERVSERMDDRMAQCPIIGCSEPLCKRLGFAERIKDGNELILFGSQQSKTYLPASSFPPFVCCVHDICQILFQYFSTVIRRREYTCNALYSPTRPVMLSTSCLNNIFQSKQPHVLFLTGIPQLGLGLGSEKVFLSCWPMDQIDFFWVSLTFFLLFSNP